MRIYTFIGLSAFTYLFYIHAHVLLLLSLSFYFVSLLFSFLQDIFQLIVSSFENLADNTSRSYAKRASILETVAKVRSCVVMLDLECDALIVEMFQHFLNSIRDYHPENVFSSMETIMILVLEESEDISPELLSPLLDSVKKGNEGVVPVAHKLGEKVLESCASKEVVPVSRKLGKKVLESCASKVKPYLVHAVKSLGLSLDDYNDVVATICQDMCGTDEQNDVHAAVENKVEENKIAGGGASDEAAQADNESEAQVASPKQADLVDGKSTKPVVSNGIAQTVEDESLPDSVTPEKQEDSKHTEQSENIDKSDNAEPDNPVAEKVVDAETKQQRTTKRRGRKANSSEKLMKPSGTSHVDGEKVNKNLSEGKNRGNDAPSSPPEERSLEVAVSTGDEASSLKVLKGDAITVATPPVNKGLPDESLSKKAGRLKKEKSIKDSAPTVDNTSKKTSEEETDSEEKLSKCLGRNAATGIAHEDEKAVITDASKEEGDNTSESEAKLLKQPSKKVKVSGNGDGSSSKQPEDKRSRIRGKAGSGKKVSKSSSEDDDKISSLKSATKSAKDEHRPREIPKADVKTKRDSGKEKVSDAEEPDENLVGSKVKVWWPLDHKFYKGVIDSYDPIKKKHKVIYNDGDVEMLNLKKQRWEFINGDGDSDSPSPDALPEIPLKKKMKTTDQTTRQEKMDSTPKSGGPSSKARSVATKSKRKLKEVSETDCKPRNDLKSIRKIEDDTGSTNKERTPKSGGKSIDTASKGPGKTKNEDAVRSKTGKSKEDDSSMPKTSKSKQDSSKTSKSKHDTPNVTSNAKEKTPKSGGKSSFNGTGKSKTGSSKVRETEGKVSKSLSVKTQESRKRKLASPTKGQGSEGKSEKKRQRGA
uniref:Uncharacterized protein n=1 Tax=Rhizophora mucronata TaxID=61149 RepID=A0A2P2LRE7_RHIMU